MAAESKTGVATTQVYEVYIKAPAQAILSDMKSVLETGAPMF